MTVKAIETEYKGYRFRSRLEARWAVAFDAMGIEWQYEPEGYVLDDGTKYLPDFKLMNVRHRSLLDQFEPIFVEVKGYLTPEDKHKVDEFPLPIVLIGEIPSDDLPHTDADCDFWSFKYIDYDMYGGFFAKHGKDIWFTGPDHDEWDMGRLMRTGINAAKKARFEHGESGYKQEKPFYNAKKPKAPYRPQDDLAAFCNSFDMQSEELGKVLIRLSNIKGNDCIWHWDKEIQLLDLYREYGFKPTGEYEHEKEIREAIATGNYFRSPD